MSWVRLYVEILDDPKTAMLPDPQFRLFCECLCLAKIANKGGDTGMSVDQLDWRLRKKNGKNVAELCRIGILTMTAEGTVSVTQWAKRQFESDSSTDRVKKHRDHKKGNVPVTVDETLQETLQQQPSAVTETSPESESESESEKESATVVAKPPRKASRKTLLPEDFAVSDRVTAWAKERGYTRLPERLEHFASYAVRNGKTYADWDEAFMGAVREDWAKLNGKPFGVAPTEAPVLPSGAWQ